MGDKAELQLRRVYTRQYGRLEAAQAFTSAALDGFKALHQSDQVAQQIQLRIKSVDSVMKKLEKKKINMQARSITLERLSRDLGDLVGARVLLYLEDGYQPFHDWICGDRSPFEIKLVKLHFRFNASDFPDVLGPNVNPAKVRKVPNKTGYFGVHYDCRINDASLQGRPEQPIERVEIQVRTLIQHSWSEVYHQHLYKSDGEKPQELVEIGRLGVVATTLRHSEREMSEARREFGFARRYTPDDAPDHSGAWSEAQEIVRQLDSEQPAPATRAAILKEFRSTHGEAVDAKLAEIADDDDVSMLLDVAELYLKCHAWVDARELYKALMPHAGAKLGWIYFRMSEAFSGEGLLRHARERLKQLNTWSQDDPAMSSELAARMFAAASYQAWDIGDNKLSKSFGDRALALIEEHASDLHPDFVVKATVNAVYFQTEYARDELPPYEWSEYLADASRLARQVITSNQENSKRLDSKAWLLATLAEGAEATGDDELARELIGEAWKAINDCFEQWDRKTPQSEQWETHRSHIVRVQRRLGTRKE